MPVLALGLLTRLWLASGTFLNPDEALHYLLANQSSWRLAYQASLTNAHPPLLTFVLYFWRGLDTSELILRLPSVIACTAFCWIIFKWLTILFGRVAGFIGLILVTFLPTLVALGSEVRQYALLLFFLAGSAYLLELALAKNSACSMLSSAIALYLAMLSHYSAILFAAAISIYSLLRLIAQPSSVKARVSWFAGQMGALGLFTSLYVTHISKLKGDYAAGTIYGWLANSFFRRGHENLFQFVFARTGGVFQYVFGQLAIGDLALLAFLAGLVLLWRNKRSRSNLSVHPWQAGILLTMPFALGAAAAVVRIYPYGGTRHSAFLIMFAVAGVSITLAELAKQRIWTGIALSILVVVICNAFAQPHRPYMLRADQSRLQMTRAIEFVRSQIPPSDLIFVDYQTRLLLGYYLCPQQPISFSAPVGSIEESQCGGHRVIATAPDLYIFTGENFWPRWNKFSHSFALQTGQAVWIMQAGWEVGLLHQLQSPTPEFGEVNAQSFGRNIMIFNLPTRIK